MKITSPKRTSVSLRALLLWTSASLFLPAAPLLAGTWIPLNNPAPGPVQFLVLLSDGSVMALNYPGGPNGIIGNQWYKLTPDSQGSYVNGTWTTLAPMASTRRFFSSAVLQDGRLFVAGAEYGSGWNTAEIYDPLLDHWTPISVPPNLITANNNPQPPIFQNTAGFSDSGSKILPNGTVLIAPVYPVTNNGTLIFNPASSTLSAGPPSLAYQNEASWVKLPDDSILTVDKSSTNTERFIPSSNTWIPDKPVPFPLYDLFAELGPGVLMANGKVLFLGANGNTAIYTPTGTTVKGAWVPGPPIPAGLAAPDAPAALLVNGHVLCAVGPLIYNGPNGPVYPGPTDFYEYDPAANAFTGPYGGDGFAPYKHMMLALPDGTVLSSVDGSPFGVYLSVYQPDLPTSGPVGKPSISRITVNPGGSFHLVGTQLNGISEGAAYGDDAQMDSNYPLVRLSGGPIFGNVYYGRTYNWNRTSVATGNTPVTTEFTVPVSVPPGTYSLVAVANGIASDPVTFYAPLWVDFNFPPFNDDGSFDYPYNTLAQGRDQVVVGGSIAIKGNGSSPERLTLSKPMTIFAVGGNVTIGQ